MLERDSVKESFYKIGENKPIIDVHTHAGFDHYGVIRRRYPTSQSIKDLVFKLDSSEVDFSVTFPCPNSTYYFDLMSLPKQEYILEPRPVESFPYEFSNRQLLYETRLFGRKKVMPFAFIFPGFEEEKQIKSLEELARKGYLFGLKHHTLVGAISARSLINSPFIELAKKYSLPVMIHSGVDQFSRPEHIMDLAENHTNVRFCIAHAGEFEKSAYERFLRLKYKNVFFDCSPFISICALNKDQSGAKIDINYKNPREALIQLYEMVANSLVWGTDEPWTTIIDNSKGEILVKVDYQDEVDLLKSLPKNIRESISFINTTKLLFG